MDLSTEAPFSQEILNRIFAISLNHPNRLSSRENSWLEFKESFGFSSLAKYLRSAASFANTKGGYIVYGIKNEPHTMLGLQNNNFDELDPARLSGFFSEHFDPEIRWERTLYELNGKIFGLLFFHEAENKPVICKKGIANGKILKEGEIYYRYNARTQVIRYSELKELIENNRKKEQEAWFKTLKEIARIGVADAAIFDLKSGSVKGTGSSFLIEESLLSQLSFIKEGEFSEKKGNPTLKLVGEVKPIGSAPIRTVGNRLKVVKVMGIRAQDIIIAFLKGEKISEASSYLKQICYEPSPFLPMYFLALQMRVNRKVMIETIENEATTCASKAKILERLNEERSLSYPIPIAKNNTGKIKLKIRSDLIQKKAMKLDVPEIGTILNMIRTLEINEINEIYLKDFLLKIFNKFYGQSDSTLNNQIRRAVCYLDWMLNKDSL